MNRRISTNPVEIYTEGEGNELEMQKTNKKTTGVDEPEFWENIIFWSSTHRLETMSSSAVGCHEGTTPTADWAGDAFKIMLFI
jgi:hypothetical protein